MPLLAGLLTALQSPTGAALAAQGAGWVAGKFMGGGQPSQQDQMQQYLQQQYMQQPQQGNFEDIRAEEMRRFNQDILPSIQQRVASGGVGGQYSSANFMQPQQAAMDLSTRLGGLRREFEQGQETQRLGRLSGLSGLLGQQQQYGLGRARQRQIGALGKAGLMQDVFGGMETLRGKEQAQRATDIQGQAEATAPQVGQVRREGTEGFFEKLISGYPELVEKYMKFQQQQPVTTSPTAPTS